MDSTHVRFLRLALAEARKSPPRPTNFCVGAVLVAAENHDEDDRNEDDEEEKKGKVLSSGYTLELPGNTHAEQCAITKYIEDSKSKKLLSTATEEGKEEGPLLNAILTPEMKVTLYTTMEPCSRRLSENASCVSRIIASRSPDPTRGIRKVVFGAKEPGDFVKDSQSCAMLDAAGVDWEYARDPQLETEILRVAKAGHGTVLQERPRDVPANPKKRMMES